MSGLAVFVALGTEVDPAVAERMRTALRPYGPDGVGVWREGGAVLGRGRTTTTPEGAGEPLPLVDNGGMWVMAFDGRLDNREELLDWLRLRQPIATDAGDSALVLALFENEGDSCVQRLVGDYAFACWNRRTRRLFCARSPVGWRSLHWHGSGRTVAVGTDARILLTLPGVPRRLNEGALAEMISMRFLSPSETLWRDISVLPAGWALAVDEHATRTWRWQSGPFPGIELSSDEAYAERFNALFDQAIRATMRAAGPVASQLSGGLDSSSIVCRGLELQRRGATAARLQPISAVYPGESHDEAPWIEAVEAHTGVRTERVTAEPYDWGQAEAWSRESLYLPLRPNTAGTLMAVCANLEPRGIRVLLTGEGGDDWFAGSPAYWPDWFAQGRWIDLLRDVHRTMAGRPWWYSCLSALSHGLRPWIEADRRRDICFPHLRLRAATPWIRADWARRTGLKDRVPAAAPLEHLRGFAQVQRSMRFQFARSYVNFENAFAYAMAHRVELRAPFHDRRLTAFAMSLPGDQLLRHGVKKHILRVAMRGTLPELVRTRLSKAAFVTPFIDAVVQRAKVRPVAQLVGVREGWLDAPSLEKMLGEHGAWTARGGTGERPESHFGAVWMAYATDLWLRGAADA